jgi:hypothetical protein
MRARRNTVHSRVENALRPQQSPNALSENPKNILLSPSGGGEDEGEGVKCGAHPSHPYPVGKRELRRAVVGQPARGIPRAIA